MWESHFPPWGKWDPVFALERLLRGWNEKGDGFGESYATGSRFPRTKILLHFCPCIMWIHSSASEGKPRLQWLKEKFAFPHSMNSGDCWLMVLVKPLSKVRAHISDPFSLSLIAYHFTVTRWLLYLQQSCLCPKKKGVREEKGPSQLDRSAPIINSGLFQRPVSCSLPPCIST